MSTAAVSESTAALVELRGLTKSFGGAKALDGVDLTVLPGEVHGLLGENGSGKSTLIKILAGFHEPDDGTLSVNGVPVRLPLKAGEYRSLGFEFVHQDLGLIPTLSVTENLFLEQVAAPKNRFFMSWNRAATQAQQVFDKYGLQINPRSAVQDIRPVERALLAIVRALEGLAAEREHGVERTLLVLDEPTVFLPQHEVSVLFDFVRQVAQRGSSVLFVSHDLDEVAEITDRISVLRDGHLAGTVVTNSTSKRQLVELIVGRELEELKPEHAETPTFRGVRMSVRGLHTRTLEDITFDLHEGEVLGLTGLVGSGYEDVVYAVYGATKSLAGWVSVSGTELWSPNLTPRAALKAGMALVPADRLRDGSIPTLSAADNINLLVLDDFFRAGRLRNRDLNAKAAELMEAYDVRPPRADLEYGSFSGGNQQKAMMAKWQQVEPAVLLLHEPTQGVDVGARQQIWDLIRRSTETSSTVCASSDYEQLAAICDRVIVIARGRVAGQLTGSDLTKDRIANFCLTQTGTPDLIARAAEI